MTLKIMIVMSLMETKPNPTMPYSRINLTSRCNKQGKQTNPRGELAGERLDEDFDLAVSSLSRVSSLATSTS